MLMVTLRQATSAPLRRRACRSQKSASHPCRSFDDLSGSRSAVLVVDHDLSAIHFPRNPLRVADRVRPFAIPQAERHAPRGLEKPITTIVRDDLETTGSLLTIVTPRIVRFDPLFHVSIQHECQSYSSLLQLHLNRRVRLLLVFGRDDSRIVAPEVPIRDRLRQSMCFEDPVVDGTLLPLGSVLRGYSALKLSGQRLAIAVGMLQQTRVPDPVQIIRLAVQDDVSAVSALVAIVLVVQRLVEVADEWTTSLSASAWPLCQPLDPSARPGSVQSGLLRIARPGTRAPCRSWNHRAENRCSARVPFLDGRAGNHRPSSQRSRWLRRRAVGWPWRACRPSCSARRSGR